MSLVGSQPNLLRVGFAGDITVDGIIPGIPDPAVLERKCEMILAAPLAVLNRKVEPPSFSATLCYLTAHAPRMRARTRKSRATRHSHTPVPYPGHCPTRACLSYL